MIPLLALLFCQPVPLALLLPAHGPALHASNEGGADVPDDVRLIVLISVDQMIPDQLERLASVFEGGFRRFLDEGEVWRRAFLQHAMTATGPGHATLATGMQPAHNGIIGNVWPATDSSASVYCVGDPQAGLLRVDGAQAPGTGRSPANLLVPGLGDYVKRADERALAIGISIKDRSAVLGIGREPDWALYWDRGPGGFASSTYYGDALPAWVGAWNATWPEKLGAGGEPFRWERLVTGDLGPIGTGPDERDGESQGRSSRSLPYSAPRAAAAPVPAELNRLAGFVYGSPVGDAFVLELAEAALDNMQLGADEACDALFIGLSSCDMVGHSYGPYSVEVTDTLVRADRALGRFFEKLDADVGEGRWIAALSSDHGVLPLVESLRADGIPARRVSLVELAEACRTIEHDLVDGFYLSHDPSGVRLDVAAIEAAGIEVDEVAAAWADELEARLDWIERAVTLDEILSSKPGDDPLLDLLRNSTLVGRSHDVQLVPKPWTMVYSSGTSHGTPWPYDRAVPVAFLGPGSPHSERFDSCASIDVVPTLLSRAGLPVPDGLDGRVLK